VFFSINGSHSLEDDFVFAHCARNALCHLCALFMYKNANQSAMLSSTCFVCVRVCVCVCVCGIFAHTSFLCHTVHCDRVLTALPSYLIAWPPCSCPLRLSTTQTAGVPLLVSRPRLRLQISSTPTQKPTRSDSSQTSRPPLISGQVCRLSLSSLQDINVKQQADFFDACCHDSMSLMLFQMCREHELQQCRCIRFRPSRG
jgi:hypothetical protein